MSFPQKRCLPCEVKKPACFAPAECRPVAKPACCPAPCCVTADVCVEKNLLTVAKVAGVTAGTFLSLVLTYEIVLFNRGGCKIVDLQVHDTFAGLATSTVLTATLAASTTDTNLLLDTNATILSSGDFLKCKSYLPSCSVSRILATLTIIGTSSNVVIDELLNTITVSGEIQTSSGECGCYKKEQEMKPISVKSELWADADGVLLVFVGP